MSFSFPEHGANWRTIAADDLSWQTDHFVHPWLDGSQMQSFDHPDPGCKQCLVHFRPILGTIAHREVIYTNYLHLLRREISRRRL